MSAFFAILLSLLAIFLILLVLVQRGRGGGLAGALGGMGGSSAFGAKAGDVFTRITIVTAAIWIGICLIAFFWADHRGDRLGRVRADRPADAALDFLPQRKADQKAGEPASPPAESTNAAPADASPPAENK